MKIKNFSKAIKYIGLPLSKIKKIELMLKSHDADVVKVQAEIDSTIINIITPYQDAIEDQTQQAD